MKIRRLTAILTIAILTLCQLGLATPLDDYVRAPDDSYRYSLAKKIDGSGYTGYVLELTSQTWRNEGEVNRTLWQHWLTIVKPDNATGDIALLLITGGRNGGDPPDSVERTLQMVALRSNSVVAHIRQVPNQPLVFPEDGKPRSEDEIISYTFAKYVQTGDATWPLLLPMVKSAVRAMDTIQSYMRQISDGELAINEFVVAGGSKRGWTTWLTGAADARVVAIMPIVIDVLNMDEQMRHHFAAYGFYSSAIHDYQDMNIFERLDTPEGQALISFVDPYEYRDRLTLPKYMLNSTGDQFFLPDSAQFYFHDLHGEKYLRYIPNTDHSLNRSDAPESLLVFYQSVLKDAERPKFSWEVTNDNIVVTTIKGEPEEVNLWQATNPEARDFRLQTIGREWESSPLEPKREGVYVASVCEPEKGWTAFFVEMVYNTGTPIPYKFTTEVHVVPDKLPFAK